MGALQVLHTYMEEDVKSALLPPANEVWGKVMFLHLSVILFTPPPPTPHPGILRDTVNKWVVYILLECILVSNDRLPHHLHGHYSQCYFVHRHIDNA